MRHGMLAVVLLSMLMIGAYQDPNCQIYNGAWVDGGIDPNSDAGSVEPQGHCVLLSFFHQQSGVGIDFLNARAAYNGATLQGFTSRNVNTQKPVRWRSDTTIDVPLYNLLLKRWENRPIPILQADVLYTATAAPYNVVRELVITEQRSNTAMGKYVSRFPMYPVNGDQTMNSWFEGPGGTALTMDLEGLFQFAQCE